MVAKNATADPQEQVISQLAENFGLKTKGQTLGEAAYSMISQRVASRFSPNVEQLGRSFAQSAGLNNQADRIGKYAGAAWRTVVPMGMTAYKSSKNIRETAGRYLNLSNDFNRSLKASGTTNLGFLTSINTSLEVVQNERKLLGSKAQNDTKTMISSLLLDVPNVLATHLQSVIDELNPNKRNTRKRKGRNELDDMADGEKKKIADKINRKIDDFLKKNSTGVDRDGNLTYDGSALNGMARALNGGEGLAELNDPEGRYYYLKDLKTKYFNDVITAGASGLKPTLTKAFNIRSDTAFNKPTAAKMIKALEEYMKKNPSPANLNLPGCSRKGCTLEDYILDIFEQHQKDCGRAEIPRRMKGRMSQAISQIAEAIADPQRQLHPEALVLLVDKKHGIASFNKGEMTEIQFGKDLDAKLEKLLGTPTLSRRKKLSAEKQMKHMQATPEQIAESWQNLSAEEKFLWSTFLSDEILLKIGVTKEECQEMRHKDNEFWRETMEEFLKEMSGLSSKELRDVGLNESQVGMLKEALDGVSKRNNQYLQENRHEMTELVADAATLMDDKQPGFLKEILTRAKERRTHKEIIEERKRDKPLAEQVMESRSESSETYRN